MTLRVSLLFSYEHPKWWKMFSEYTDLRPMQNFHVCQCTLRGVRIP